MDTTPLQVQMLNCFVLRRGGEEVQISGRSRKLCELLAILICERNRPIPYPELIELLWLGETQGANPLNSLKALLHRARLCLNKFETQVGHGLILNRDGCFQWAPDLPLTLDTEEFSRLCHNMNQREKELEIGLEALSHYQGDFLPMLSDSPWAAEKAAELHQLYLQTTQKVLPLLEARERWQEMAQLAGTALTLEPCHEEFCIQQMEALLRLNRCQEAVRVYEAFQDRLLAQLGVMPSDSLRVLCRKARQDRDSRALSPDTLLERLEEPPRPGTLLCDFDFFQVLCHATARRAGRSGEPVHVALLSLSSPEGSSLPRYSLDRAMDHLQEIMITRLRQGDAVARCGASQFVVLLPQASLKNSQMVCRRITQSFTRQFPHSPVVLSVSVQPLSFRHNA